MKTDWRHETNVKHFGVSVAALVVAVVGTGYSIYASEEAKDKQEEAQQKIDIAKQKEEDRLQQISDDTRANQETASVEFGADREEDVGTAQDLLIEKNDSSTTSLTSAGSSGLAATSATNPFGL